MEIDDLIDVNEFIDKAYISKFDWNLPTSAERVKLFEKMTIDDIRKIERFDDTGKVIKTIAVPPTYMVDYLSGDIYKKKQVKQKKDFLTEQDVTMKKLELIATYILRPDFKEYNIRSNQAMKEIGLIKDKNTQKRHRFDRIKYLEEIVAKINKKQIYDNEYITTDDFVSKLVELNDDSPLWDVFEFSNHKHVKKLLDAYPLFTVAIEDRPDTRAWTIIITLNELINSAKLSMIDRDVLYLVQSGLYSYNDIRKMINNKHKTTLHYKAVERKIRFYIPKKISKSYQKQLKRIKIP